MSKPFATSMAFLFVALIASVPLVLASLSTTPLTKVHVVESVALIMWLGGALYTFTSVLKFNSIHFDGARTLTVVESIYLLAQIMTTVGYGDIVPAYPRGQVFLAFYVLAALLLYGSIMLEVSGIIAERVAESVELHFGTPRTLRAHEELQKSWSEQPLKDWHSPREWNLEYGALIKSSTVFGITAIAGIYFYHTYPGEEKTWFQAVYMSIITLSTVGFGAFTAVTTAGMVFGAFWMIMGVSALGSVIGCSVELVLKVKEKERYSAIEDKLKFYESIEKCVLTPDKGSKHESSGKYMDEYAFMKFGLIHMCDISEEEIERIEQRFIGLQAENNEDGRLTLQEIQNAERPPMK